MIKNDELNCLDIAHFNTHTHTHTHTHHDIVKSSFVMIVERRF